MKIIVQELFKMWAEDSYEQGEIGKTFQNSLTKQIKGEMFDSYKELKDFLVKNFDLTKNDDAWLVFEDGRIDVQQLESDDGYLVTDRDSEFKQWQEGEINLWSATYSIYVEVIDEPRVPTTREISQESGWKEY